MGKLLLFCMQAAFWLFFIWILLLCGRKHNGAWQRLSGWRYAHRGLHSKPQIPENSLPAFRRAVERGFGAELDVHLLKDGTLAIIHDSDTERVTGKKAVVEDLTLADLEDFRLEGTEEKIPLFDQVLEIFEKEAPLIIELKPYNGNHKELAEAVCKRLDSYEGDFCLESFDFRCVLAVKKLRPSWCRGQLSYNSLSDPKAKEKYPWALRFMATNLLTNVITTPDFIAYNYPDRKNWSNGLACRLWGMRRVSWTLRTMEELKTAEAEKAIAIFEKFDPHTGETL